MYKALIIDDEKPVRQVIKALGMWREMNIEYVYEAVEGESALKIMRKNNPEIVFLDMNMPNMNGVDFLKAAGKEFPGSKYIVISGYDDFKYTKQAINSKVLDYLLKPVGETELNNVLSRAVNELNEERQHKIENIRATIAQNISIPLAKERIFTLILENEDEVPLIEDTKRILDISDSYSCYGVIILNIINFDQVCSSAFKGDAYSTFFALTNVINELSSDWCSGFSFKNSKANSEIILVAMAPAEDEKEFESSISDRINKIIEKLEELFGTFCIASIGKLYSEFDLLNKSYKSAVEILNSVNILDCNDKVFTKRNTDVKSKRISLMDKEEILIYAFESGSIEYARNIINQYFDNIREQGYLSSDDLYKTAMEFILIIENIIEQLDISEARNNIRILGSARSLMSFTRLEDLKEFISEVIEKVFNYVQSNMKASEKANLYEIRDYIHKNYNKEIKLSTFSNKYYISKEYLSKQFKAEFGYGIYEYVLKVRMEKAKEMVSNTELKIQEISERLGYKDNNYFRRAFKNYFGVYPSECRNKE